MENVPLAGLSTREALNRLQYAIKTELQNHEASSKTGKFHSWIREAYHHNSPYSTFTWTSCAITCFEVFMLLVYQACSNENFRLKSMAAETFFLIFFLVLNVLLQAWDTLLRRTEMKSKIKSLLQIIEDSKQYCWVKGYYSNLHTPQSPCVSVQWTFRDRNLVNLPCSLLVEGDIILMRPGHTAPGKCKSIDKSLSSQIHLNAGEVFAPAVNHINNENFNTPQLRTPACASQFLMLETTFETNVRYALQNALKRPVTVFNKQYHAIVFHYLERIVVPIIVVVILCIGSIRTAYLDSKNSDWTEHLLLRSVLAVLPLIPLSFPLCWIVLNAYGNAYLLAYVHVAKQKLATGSELGNKEWKSMDPFDEIEELSKPVLEHSVTWRDTKDLFLKLLFGRGSHLYRSANLLHVLGSLTALCCVDKKGILSWPNPTAEKVFFLKSPKSKSSSEDNAHLYSYPADTVREKHEAEALDNKNFSKSNKRLDIRDHMYHPSSQVEVLDLTHDLHSPFGIQFDDPNWKCYIGNLKPLGLGILLNTCNPKSQDHYTKFCDHIACESLYNAAAVPVVNKRCLCELATQIGFSDTVVDFYELEQQLGIFRHVHPAVVRKGKLAKSLNFPRLKMPFPNISCVVVKDLHRGSHQLFSQGTADLVLDACNEYWDGEDIRVLTDSDRKRILDFYHRSSLTAHCMGYAYSPLNDPFNRNFSSAYIELPSEGSHLFSDLASACSPRSWDAYGAEAYSRQHSLSRYLSNDSLLLPEQPEEKTEEWYSGPNSCLQQLGNEIFIGMVTMQYQACPDFVQLIEHLDKACIRFVHFSKENELRSRVFSEKMGLESGWNCHISLLSDDTSSKTGKTEAESSSQQRHYVFPDSLSNSKKKKETKVKIPVRYSSAPSIMKLETVAVKFDDSSIQSRSEESVSASYAATNKMQLGAEKIFQLGYEDTPAKKSISSIQDIFMDDSNVSHSPSHVTESTDQSAPVTFDMSNRAKLPKGTENIRPHIENVDNVPLQVSLFTDCTAEATREMICIMQEYGEVVCCLGSSANSENISIFLQADASIATEPLHPQLCMQQPVFECEYNPSSLSPSDLSSHLNSLPCGLCFHKEDPVSLYHLIMEARHFVFSVRNGLLFMLCCCLSIVLLQVIGTLFFLPLTLPLAHVLWLICLEVPLLSLSLLGNPVDPHVMTLATGKNLKVTSKQALLFFMACYGAKFCPSVIIAVMGFGCMMVHFCQYFESGSHLCWMFLEIREGSSHLYSSDSWAASLTVSQNALSVFIIICFVVISLNFIHRSHLLWKSNPFDNKYWLVISILVIFLQVIFSTIDIKIHVAANVDPLQILHSIPYYIWLVGSIWPLILVPLNELVKRHEIKVSVRQQKRARLEFCTKLGMNSPF